MNREQVDRNRLGAVLARARGTGALALVAVLGCGLGMAGSAGAASLGSISEFSSGLNSGSDPQPGLVAGRDGNFWFADDGMTRRSDESHHQARSPNTRPV